MRALPLVVAALLAVAPLVVAVDAPAGASAGPADRQLDTTRSAVNAGATSAAGSDSVRVLDTAPGATTGRSIEAHSVDLGPAVGFASNATEARLGTLTMVERVTAAESVDKRQRRILDELNEVEQQVIVLRGEQRRAISAYGAGDIGARELLVRLARVDARARTLETRRERIAELAEETDGFGLDSGRLAGLERELDTYTGPVRSRAGDVLGGEATPSRFYVETGPNSVVLTTVADERYVREAYRGDLRSRGSGGMTPETALNTTAKSYPVIWATKQNSTEVVGSGDSYQVRVSHERGSLVTFVDSGSGNVFKEFQSRPLRTFDAGESVSGTRDGLSLTVNRIYPGGPLHVRLNESATDEPAAANITVGLEGEESTLVGTTGGDGELWTLAPGGTFTVTAIRSNSVVVLTVEPSDPPRIGDRTPNATSGGDDGNATDGSGTTATTPSSASAVT